MLGEGERVVDVVPGAGHGEADRRVEHARRLDGAERRARLGHVAVAAEVTLTLGPEVLELVAGIVHGAVVLRHEAGVLGVVADAVVPAHAAVGVHLGRPVGSGCGGFGGGLAGRRLVDLRVVLRRALSVCLLAAAHDGRALVGPVAVLLHVLGQVRLLRVALSAVLADVRLEVLGLLVLGDVLEEGALVGEALVARVALVGLVGLVAARVGLEVGELREGLGAAGVAALVRLVAGVGADVLLEVAQLSEFTLANLAPEGGKTEISIFAKPGKGARASFRSSYLYGLIPRWILVCCER